MADAISNDAFGLKRRLPCAIFLLLGGSWFFLVEFFDLYHTINPHRDVFYWNALFIAVSWLAILIVGILSFIRMVGGTFDRTLACQLLFVLFAVASDWFRLDLVYAADRAFLWLNEDKFRAEISRADPANNSLAVILHRMSTNNVHKIFIYVGFRTLDNGRLSLDTLDSLGSGLDAFRGCKVYSERLHEGFYLLEIGC
jgi:hypothetical protein